MPDQHYFTESPDTPSQEREITETIRGGTYRFITDAGVFSKDRVDVGSRLLIESVTLPEEGNICDIGCGYGPIGIVAAKLAPECQVYLVDVNARAVALAEKNLELNSVENARVFQGDGFAPFDERSFRLILTNPPIRTGKRVIYPLVEDAHRHLGTGGRLCLVIRTKQGAKSMEKHMETVFGNVDTVAKGSGYRILESVRMD